MSNFENNKSVKLLKRIVYIMGILLLVGFVSIIAIMFYKVGNYIKSGKKSCDKNEYNLNISGDVHSWHLSSDETKIYLLFKEKDSYILKIKNLCK